MQLFAIFPGIGEEQARESTGFIIDRGQRVRRGLTYISSGSDSHSKKPLLPALPSTIFPARAANIDSQSIITRRMKRLAMKSKRQAKE
jgi:hypothetical protein